MKRINTDTGGRPIFQDDLIVIEQSYLDAVTAEYKGKGAFILTGVVPAGSVISSGVVVIDNEIMRYEGDTGVSYPKYLVKSESTSENATFEDSSIKPLYKEVRAILSSSIPSSGEYITITSSGGRRYINDVLSQSLVSLQGSQTISGNKSFTGNISFPNVISTSNVPNLDASKINSGTLSVSRIPNLDASKLNSGTLSSARIPNISASKLTSGFLDTDRLAEESISPSKIAVGGGTLDDAIIPNLSGNIITTGTINVDRLPDDVKHFTNWDAQGDPQEPISVRVNTNWVHVKGELNSSSKSINLSTYGSLLNQTIEYSAILTAKNTSSLSDNSTVTMAIESGILRGKLTGANYQGGTTNFDSLVGQDIGNSFIRFDLYLKKS